ncbi:hypothetical protein ANCCAN_03373 [Ancylostoma caninum]|uniref:Uncharacterized protein n=1 Tax=Ancylostoma caninum TaxID=29170 RepID=A0A368H4E9_ANCCA|nr:hypothetical protein ANCCAN_03373 [Ancylostoma caninum]
MVTCNLCGKKLADEEARFISTARHQRAVLFAALLARYNVDAEFLKGLYSLSASKRLRICHNHFIEAAQFMGAEMMLAGYNFHHFEGVAFGKAAKIVVPGDIPASLLDQLNRFVGDFDGELRLTPEQVAAFMKDAITRYYTASGWELTTRREDRRRSDGLKQGVDGETAHMDCEEDLIASREDVQGPTAPVFDVEMEEEQEQPPSFASPVFSNFSPRDASGSVDDMLDDGVDLRGTDPSLLNSFFLVQGIATMGKAASSRVRVRLALLEVVPMVQTGNRESLPPAPTKGVRRSSTQESQGLHLAADGAFDSRGYSALIDGSSSQMEVEGLRRLLQWLTKEGWNIASITTDRNRSFATLLAELEGEIGSVQHFWDGWHLVKWFGNNLRKEAKHKDCVPLSVWYEKLKTHLWRAIEVGEGERIRHIFNTCLKHVQDVHAWPKDETTGKITRCGHPPLEGPRPETMMEGTPAFDRLSRLVLNRNLQKDLAKASPRGGTSICESKNALDRLYCRKEIFYPLFTYKLYTMLSTMHFNTLRFAEMAGERKVQRVIDVQRKYFRRTTRMVFKTPVEHLWRDQIAQAVLDSRREHHELPPEDVDLQGMIDAEAAFEEAEPEDILEFCESDDDEYEEEL